MARTPAENIDVLRDRIRTSDDIADDDGDGHYDEDDEPDNDD